MFINSMVLSVFSKSEFSWIMKPLCSQYGAVTYAGVAINHNFHNRL